MLALFMAASPLPGTVSGPSPVLNKYWANKPAGQVHELVDESGILTAGLKVNFLLLEAEKKHELNVHESREWWRDWALEIAWLSCASAVQLRVSHFPSLKFSFFLYKMETVFVSFNRVFTKHLALCHTIVNPQYMTVITKIELNFLSPDNSPLRIMIQGFPNLPGYIRITWREHGIHTDSLTLTLDILIQGDWWGRGEA